MDSSVTRCVSRSLFPCPILPISFKSRANFPQKLTVRVVLPEIGPEEAVMIAVPVVTAVARPLLLTVATWGFDEVQVPGIV